MEEGNKETTPIPIPSQSILPPAEGRQHDTTAEQENYMTTRTKTKKRSHDYHPGLPADATTGLEGRGRSRYRDGSASEHSPTMSDRPCCKDLDRPFILAGPLANADHESIKNPKVLTGTKAAAAAAVGGREFVAVSGMEACGPAGGDHRLRFVTAESHLTTREEQLLRSGGCTMSSTTTAVSQQQQQQSGSRSYGRRRNSTGHGTVDMRCGCTGGREAALRGLHGDYPVNNYWGGGAMRKAAPLSAGVLEGMHQLLGDGLRVIKSAIESEEQLNEGVLATVRSRSCGPPKRSPSPIRRQKTDESTLRNASHQRLCTANHFMPHDLSPATTSGMRTLDTSECSIAHTAGITHGSNSTSGRHGRWPSCMQGGQNYRMMSSDHHLPTNGAAPDAANGAYWMRHPQTCAAAADVIPLSCGGGGSTGTLGTPTTTSGGSPSPLRCRGVTRLEEPRPASLPRPRSHPLRPRPASCPATAGGSREDSTPAAAIWTVPKPPTLRASADPTSEFPEFPLSASSSRSCSQPFTYYQCPMSRRSRTLPLRRVMSATNLSQHLQSATAAECCSPPKHHQQHLREASGSRVFTPAAATATQDDFIDGMVGSSSGCGFSSQHQNMSAVLRQRGSPRWSKGTRSSTATAGSSRPPLPPPQSSKMSGGGSGTPKTGRREDSSSPRTSIVPSPHKPNSMGKRKSNGVVDPARTSVDQQPQQQADEQSSLMPNASSAAEKSNTPPTTTDLKSEDESTSAAVGGSCLGSVTTPKAVPTADVTGPAVGGSLQQQSPHHPIIQNLHPARLPRRPSYSSVVMAAGGGGMSAGSNSSSSNNISPIPPPPPHLTSECDNNHHAAASQYTTTTSLHPLQLQLSPPPHTTANSFLEANETTKPRHSSCCTSANDVYRSQQQHAAPHHYYHNLITVNSSSSGSNQAATSPLGSNNGAGGWDGRSTSSDSSGSEIRGGGHQRGRRHSHHSDRCLALFSIASRFGYGSSRSSGTGGGGGGGGTVDGERQSRSRLVNSGGHSGSPPHDLRSGDKTRVRRSASARVLRSEECGSLASSELPSGCRMWSRPIAAAPAAAASSSLLTIEQQEKQEGRVTSEPLIQPPGSQQHVTTPQPVVVRAEDEGRLDLPLAQSTTPAEGGCDITGWEGADPTANVGGGSSEAIVMDAQHCDTADCAAEISAASFVTCLSDATDKNVATVSDESLCLDQEDITIRPKAVSPNHSNALNAPYAGITTTPTTTKTATTTVAQKERNSGTSPSPSSSSGGRSSGAYREPQSSSCTANAANANTNGNLRRSISPRTEPAAVATSSGGATCSSRLTPGSSIPPQQLTTSTTPAHACIPPQQLTTSTQFSSSSQHMQSNASVKAPPSHPLTALPTTPMTTTTAAAHVKLLLAQGQAALRSAPCSAAVSFKGRKPAAIANENQDRWLYIEHPTLDYTACGVFDGHGPHGHHVAEYVKSRFENCLAFLAENFVGCPDSSCLPNNNKNGSAHVGGGGKQKSSAAVTPNASDSSRMPTSSWPSFSQLPPPRLEFEEWMDEQFALIDTSLHLQSFDSNSSGTTVLIVVRISNRIFASWCGDSKVLVIGYHHSNSSSSAAALLPRNNDTPPRERQMGLENRRHDSYCTSRLSAPSCGYDRKVCGDYGGDVDESDEAAAAEYSNGGCGGLPCVALETSDHVPDRADELSRIEKAGGTIRTFPHPFLQKQKTVRIFPYGIAMSRAFGDYNGRPFGLISEPEHSFMDLTNDCFASAKHFCILAATDGLWDSMQIEEVQRTLQVSVDQAETNPGSKSVEEFLRSDLCKMTKTAQRRRFAAESYSDDTTAVCTLISPAS